MKEYKFRAYDVLNKKMVFNNDTVLPSRLYQGQYMIYDDDTKHYCGFKGIVMQYTGLKDKNGKEIYEFDILQDLKYPEQYWLVRFEDGEFGCELIEPYIKECAGGISEQLQDICDDSEIVCNKFNYKNFKPIRNTKCMNILHQ